MMKVSTLWSASMGYPKDPKLKGLAAVTYHPEHLPWEFDIRAVEPDSDEVPRVSDWHRRHGRANRKDGNTERAARALAPRPNRGHQERDSDDAE